MLSSLSIYIIPVIFFIILGYGLFKRVNIFDAFLSGASSGINTTINILPALVGLIAAITMFRTSGALDFLIKLISPITDILHLPQEVMPLALLRPVSGSSSLAIVGDILARYGPDSIIGQIASVMMGSTETTFYAVCIYFGSINITDSRYTLIAALCADFTGFLASVWVCRLFFG